MLQYLKLESQIFFEVLQCKLKKKLTQWFSLFCKKFHKEDSDPVNTRRPEYHMNASLTFSLGSMSKFFTFFVTL